MGKRGGKKRNNGGGGASSSSGQVYSSLSLQEQASGKKQSHNTKSILKLNHFQNLAQWASGLGDCKDNTSVGCLGAFFGRRFAEFGESLGIFPDPCLFPCQRCETLLKPGSNCTIRIEKNRAKSRRRSKTKTATQNNVVYTCHFCSYRNLKRGTPKGHMRDLTASKATSLKPNSVNSASQTCVTVVKSNFSNVKADKITETPLPVTCSNVNADKAIETPLPVTFSNVKADKTIETPLPVTFSNVKGDKTIETHLPVTFSNVKADKTIETPLPAVSNTGTFFTDSPTSLLAKSGAKLLDSKRRKRSELKKSGNEKLVSSAPAEKETASGTRKRRKKSWTSLKDIADREQHERNQRFANFSIPFVL